MRIPVRRDSPLIPLNVGNHEVTIKLTLDEFYEMIIWLNMHSET